MSSKPRTWSEMPAPIVFSFPRGPSSICFFARDGALYLQRYFRTRMKTAWFAILLVIAVAGCKRQDPIDRLMTELPYEDVPSYLFLSIKLPETATPEQLLSALSNRGYFQQEDITSFSILEKKDTHTVPPTGWGEKPEPYTAVLLKTDAGQKIMLFRSRDSRGWYYKMYDVNARFKPRSFFGL
jgi:hypothetical protein